MNAGNFQQDMHKNAMMHFSDFVIEIYERASTVFLATNMAGTLLQTNGLHVNRRNTTAHHQHPDHHHQAPPSSSTLNPHLGSVCYYAGVEAVPGRCSKMPVKEFEVCYGI
ncbi:hypothetical protein MLD38_016866 [Melastoma candidum]|uniref:Uncharacterized protein n=1 Tax=Melastoma candidum TaxID=119954 RepID=A0ACB9QNP3_9MYRT|nr:hypothetical protein MLD38_016866 [Melastoma candidum]